MHVEYLARELRAFEDVTVHAWGADAGDVPPRRHGVGRAGAATRRELAALRAVSIDLTMAAGAEDADLVHSHTWYANFGGHLAKLLYGIPHVATVHSLEPLRPWKEEQLGGGYRALELLRAHRARERRRRDRGLATARGATSSASIPRSTPSAST